ncbi:MAG TPA: hypothetical protein VF944_04080 [Candidatus Bathyarchaeia archaeon]
MTRKLDLLPWFALPCIFVAVVLENIIGTDFTTILGTIGATSLITWFVRRNSEVDSPRNVATRKYLNIGLVLLGLGTLVVSIAAAENILSSSGLAGIPLEIVGTGIFVSGAVGMILVFALIHPKPKS